MAVFITALVSIVVAIVFIFNFVMGSFWPNNALILWVFIFFVLNSAWIGIVIHKLNKLLNK